MPLVIAGCYPPSSGQEPGEVGAVNVEVPALLCLTRLAVPEVPVLLCLPSLAVLHHADFFRSMSYGFLLPLASSPAADVLEQGH